MSDNNELRKRATFKCCFHFFFPILACHLLHCSTNGLPELTLSGVATMAHDHRAASLSRWNGRKSTVHAICCCEQSGKFIDLLTRTLLTAWSSLRRVCAFVHHHQTCQSSKAASSRLVWKQNKREMNLVPMVTALLLSTVPGHHIGPPCMNQPKFHHKFSVFEMHENYSKLCSKVSLPLSHTI